MSLRTEENKEDNTSLLLLYLNAKYYGRFIKHTLYRNTVDLIKISCIEILSSYYTYRVEKFILSKQALSDLRMFKIKKFITVGVKHNNIFSFWFSLF